MKGRTNANIGGYTRSCAIIKVEAPTGSSVSFSKGGVVVAVIEPSKSHIKNADNDYAYYYYTVKSNNYGEWTIQAFLDAEESNAEVITIDGNELYEVALDFTYWIYDEGKEFTNRTGGWEIKKEGSSYVASKQPTYLDIASVQSNGQAIATVDQVDLTKFTKFCCRLRATSGATTYKWMTVWSGAAYATSTGRVLTQTVPNSGAGAIVTADISGLNGSYRVGFQSWNANNFQVDRAWLE